MILNYAKEFGVVKDDDCDVVLSFMLQNALVSDYNWENIVKHVTWKNNLDIFIIIMLYKRDNVCMCICKI